MQTKPTYQILRTSDQAMLIPHVAKADTFWSRLLGLMGKPTLPTGHGLWISPCADIHSCFMRFPFDAVFVDKNGTILKTIEHMPAWRLSPWVKGSVAVLELPGGSVQATGLKVGETILLQPCA